MDDKAFRKITLRAQSPLKNSGEPRHSLLAASQALEDEQRRLKKMKNKMRACCQAFF